MCRTRIPPSLSVRTFGRGRRVRRDRFRRGALLLRGQLRLYGYPVRRLRGERAHRFLVEFQTFDFLVVLCGVLFLAPFPLDCTAGALFVTSVP